MVFYPIDYHIWVIIHMPSNIYQVYDKCIAAPRRYGDASWTTTV